MNPTGCLVMCVFLYIFFCCVFVWCWVVSWNLVHVVNVVISISLFLMLLGGVRISKVANRKTLHVRDLPPVLPAPALDSSFNQYVKKINLASSLRYQHLNPP